MTGDVFIGPEQLGSITEQCITGLHDDSTTKLFELAGVMNAIADCKSGTSPHFSSGYR